MDFKLVVLISLLALVSSGFAAPSSLNLQNVFFQNRVLGGHNAKVGEFPHQISLQYSEPQINVAGTHYCGGSIIHEDWILTAAHCVLPFIGILNPIIRAGKHNISAYEQNEQVHEAESVYVHESFEGLENPGPYDIALIKLKSPLKYNQYIQPIKLPETDAETVGDVILSGWGVNYVDPLWSTMKSPSILQTVVMKVIDFDTCDAIMEQNFGESPLHSTNLCTGPITGGISGCYGDSGGPLIANNDDQMEIVGIVSYGGMPDKPCGVPGAPSIFTKVSSHIQWINTIIEENK